ncbi:hypothetical protein V1511DRAFT_493768 [Dipodascopsis uninucleata]
MSESDSKVTSNHDVDNDLNGIYDEEWGDSSRDDSSNSIGSDIEENFEDRKHQATEFDREIEKDLSKTAQITDFKNLLNVLERNHRTSLALHLAVSARLMGKERKHRLGNLETSSRLAIRPSWTAWPLPARNNMLDNSDVDKYELGHLGNFDEKTKDTEESPIRDGYESHVIERSNMFAAKLFMKPLISEISAACIRSLTKKDRIRRALGSNEEEENMYSNSELEKDLLFPHAHETILSFIDRMIEALATIRISQAPDSVRHRLDKLSWQDVLTVAGMIGIPFFDASDNVMSDDRGRWVEIIESVRKSCQNLFPEDPAPPPFTVLPRQGGFRKEWEPGELVRGRGWYSKKKEGETQISTGKRYRTFENDIGYFSDSKTDRKKLKFS